jgi:hypothetical protein
MTETQRLAPSIELNRRVIEAGTAYTLSRMKILERIPGNPLGIAYRKVGEATALSAKNLPSTFFNNVVGLRAEQASEIESLVEWYRERGQGARFEIAAADHDPSLGRELARLGFFQSGFHAALIREVEPLLWAPPGISVEPVMTAADMEDFLTAAKIASALQRGCGVMRTWPLVRGCESVNNAIESEKCRTWHRPLGKTFPGGSP